MAKKDNDGESTATKPEENGQEAKTPQLRILRQYVKDLSFENPLAVEMDGFGDKKPDIEVNMEVVPKHVRDADWEVSLRLTARASAEQNAVFLAEVLYGGLIQVENVPEDNLKAVISIEGPRQLFPFARRILADLVRDGGFPTLLLPPVDFAQLYRIGSKAKTNAEMANE